jgi:hypothetical protein
MKSVVVPIPPGWRLPRPQLLEYVVAEGALVTMSNVQGLPEDPPSWMTVELQRRAGGALAEPPALTRLTMPSGWPALVAEASFGLDRMMLVLYPFLELGAVASFRAPAPVYDAHRAQVLEVLTSAQISWGEPPVTLARLLAGARPILASVGPPDPSSDQT